LSVGKSLRILIVEDEILIALELESLLQDAGHCIVGIAASSREAVASGTELRPDLAFVDIHLSDGPTGVEVARHLAEEGITVLFMTANAKRIPEDCAGAHGVISKPYTERGVHQAIDYIRTVQSGKAAPQVEETMTFVPFDFAGDDRSTRA
jgi:CheY-like chemotaxis protein